MIKSTSFIFKNDGKTLNYIIPEHLRKEMDKIIKDAELYREKVTKLLNELSDPVLRESVKRDLTK